MAASTPGRCMTHTPHPTPHLTLLPPCVHTRTRVLRQRETGIAHARLPKSTTQRAASQPAPPLLPPTSPQQPSNEPTCTSVQPPSPQQSESQRLKVSVISWLSSRRLAERCVASIALAMVGDPTNSYYCQPGRELQFYRSSLRVMLQSRPFSYQIVSVEDGACAAVCATLPSQEVLYAWGLLTALPDMLAVLTAMQPPRLVEAFSGSDALEDRRNAFVQERGGQVLYLLTIGTDPQRQGQGLGGEVMRVLTEFADRQQVPFYLEASSERNVVFYQRHGFKSLSSLAPSPSAPAFTLMCRPPCPPPQPPAAGEGTAAASSAAGGVAGGEGVPQRETSGAAAGERPGGLFGQYQRRSSTP